MFKNSFSFNGRIRRTEYGISLIVYLVAAFIVNVIIQLGGAAGIIILAYIPMLWFLFAQGAKRCHDRGNSGWYQIIPFYVFWMIFDDSVYGINEYGTNPKVFEIQQKTESSESLVNQDTSFFLNDEDYIKRCSELEFHEEVETRKWNSNPDFAKVLTPYNERQFDKAIKEGFKIISKFYDFDILYNWIGSSYRELSMFEKSNNLLLEGLKKSKRKSLLLIDLAEIAWRLNSIETTIYYLSQALHCTIRVEEHNIYLLLYYIAKGMALENEANSFLRQVDKLKSGQYRLIVSDANKLTTLSSKSVNNNTYKKIIIQLCEKYCK